MTAKTRCLKHKLLYSVGKMCPKCAQEYRKRYEVHSRDPESVKFYNSKDWKSCRQEVLDFYCGVDIFHLGLTGKIVACGRMTVHHIYPRSKYPSKALNFDNLIPVSMESHKRIHELYDSGQFVEAVAIIEEGKAIYERLRTAPTRDI